MLLKGINVGGGRKIYGVMLKKLNTQRKTMFFKDIMFNFDIRPQETSTLKNYLILKPTFCRE